MTPIARVQATIDILDDVFTSWASEKRFPADKSLDRYFKANRYIGSKDRAAIGELFYWVLRHKAALEWHCTYTGKRDGHVSRYLPKTITARELVLAALVLRKSFTTHQLRTQCDGSKHTPSPLSPDENTWCLLLETMTLQVDDMPTHVRLNFPEWLEAPLRETFGASFEEAVTSLNSQASTDLRVNTLKTSREALLKNLQEEEFLVEPTALSSIGLRLQKRAPIFTSRYFKEGHFEIQDEGSQVLAMLVKAEPGMRVIDFCAGAGGKTLAIAAQMQNKGKILAWDVSEKRLTQIKERLRRAGVDNVQIHVITSETDSFIKRHKDSADRVLVDAPCSGTGTWRRNPDLKWRFTPTDLQEVVALQRSILQSAARLVKPGGRLIYATCSVLRQENEQQIEEFLKSSKDFRVVCAEKIWNNIPIENDDSVSYFSVSPHQDGVDGFFAAIMERAS